MKAKSIKIIMLIMFAMTLFVSISVKNVYADGDIYVKPDMPGQAECDLLFGDPNKPESVASLVNEVMGYIRVIVPVLTIVLGTVDLFKAIIASNPEAMKKAQNSFIKRLIFAVVVFLVPSLIKILMWVIDVGLNAGKPCTINLG